MMEVSKKEKKCVRYLTKEMSKTDSALFEIELILDDELKIIYENYKLIWNQYPIDNLFLNDDSFKDEINAPRNGVYYKKIKKTISKNYGVIFSLAFLLLFLSNYFFSTVEIDYTNHMATAEGEKHSLYLPDSTLVYLNASSEIKYPNAFKNTREVYVKGEAYFDVTHNKIKPFIVHTEELDIKVLGTSFNVNTVSANKTISLERGKVNVMIKKAKNQLDLLPNEQLVYNNKTNDITKKNFSVTKVLAWKNNVLILDNILLKNAISKINKFYGVNFILENEILENKRISGEFKDQNIQEFISSIEFIADIAVDTISNNEYLIKENHGN